MTKQAIGRVVHTASYRFAWLFFVVALARGDLLSAATSGGTLTLKAFDQETKEPLAARLELRDNRGRPVRARAEGAIVVGDSIYFDSMATVRLAPGHYTFLAEVGPEFITRPGNFTVEPNSEGTQELLFERKVNMHKEGWWAGDLDVQLREEELPLIMKARAVDFVPLTTAVNDHGKCRELKPASKGRVAKPAVSITSQLLGRWAAADCRRGNCLLAISFQKLPDVCHWKADDSSLGSAEAAHEAGTCVALTPFSWDLPLWVANHKLDAVDVISRHSRLNAAIDNEGDGRPRERIEFSGKSGNGRYAEAIYHHLLNCGLRIPPAAGSGAGATVGGRSISSPLGTNRMYVHCGETCTRESWMESLRAGRVSVTNGPLLRVKVEGQPPGHVFQLEAGEKREFPLALNLAFYEATQVEYLEIVKNGQAIHQIRVDEFAKKGGRLPGVPFDASGWFLVRAVTNNSNVYQFATTGPYYVEANYQPRISRGSVQYFLTWLDDAAKKFAGNAAVLAEIEAARPFWKGLLAKANAD
jgi:hypothetical protein